MLARASGAVTIFLAALGVVWGPGCQTEGCQPGEPCACTAEEDGCICKDGGDCDLACPDPGCEPTCTDAEACSAECGESCTFKCTRATDCSVNARTEATITCSKVESCDATCGESCWYLCEDAATCRVNAGTGSTIACNRVGTCEIACEKDCIASCTNTGTCEITCLAADPITCVDGRPGCGEGCFIQ